MWFSSKGHKYQEKNFEAAFTYIENLNIVANHIHLGFTYFYKFNYGFMMA